MRAAECCTRKTEKKHYEGNFDKGLYSGKGVLYDSQGQVVYKGEFEQGNYSGTGVLYSEGQKIYEGEFASGKYEGGRCII